MKAFTIVLLCVLAVVQGRVLSSEPEEPSVNLPWLVHLRFSRLSLRGNLDSCVGTLYNNRWVITAASCLTEVIEGTAVETRYIWVRYDAQNVFRPGFVTETSQLKVHPEYNPETGANDIGLIDLNREIEFTDRIQPIALADSDAELPTSGRVCGYGAKGEEAGEDLLCVDVPLYEDEGLLFGQDAGNATKYDLGAALVSDGKVFGVLVRPADEKSTGAFLPTSKYVAWIEEETAVKEPESDEEEESFVVGDDVLVAEPILTF